MEEMMIIKKEIKKMLKKEFGDEFCGCFYMNKKQMEKREATIYVGCKMRNDNEEFHQGGKIVLGKEFDERRKVRYEKLTKILEKYGYKYKSEIKYFDEKWSCILEQHIRLYF